MGDGSEVTFRAIATVVLMATLGTSAVFRYRARTAAGYIPRRDEGARFVALRVAVALPLFAGPLLFVVWPESIAWAQVRLPASARWSGVALGLASVAAAQWVFRSLGTNVGETVLTKEGQQLVTFGPYRWVRHPLYTTGLALFLSVGLMAASGFILVCTLLAGLGIGLLVIPSEEEELVRRFGDEYVQYREQSGRLVPRLGGRGERGG